MKRVVALLALAGALAACGTTPAAQPATQSATQPAAQPAGSQAPAAALPVTIKSADGTDVEVKDAGRIIPLNGEIAEIVFALGLKDKVVGVDLSAMGLPEAQGKPQVGYARTLAAEGVLALKPTVLVGTTDAGPPEVLEQIKNAGVPLVQVPTAADSVDSVPAKIETVAAAVGEPAKGKELAAKVAAEIAAAKTKGAAVTTKPKVAFLYLRGQQKTYMIGGKGAKADAMITAAGGIDAGSEAGIQGYKPITAEAMVTGAPDIILVMEDGLESVGGIEGLLKLPGVAQTPAGKDKRIVSMDGLELLGMSLRTGPALDKLVAAFQAK
ncbi:hemin ABC transporter substrate-binding protein [Nonomuraea sp. NPDC050663]|uniref:hemin ABC transporter substrate-binding protein n=1 Tax=Nonomuraea sp. NPDC050663 TaxID=3364370 RepID=UPI00379A5F8E